MDTWTLLVYRLDYGVLYPPIMGRRKGLQCLTVCFRQGVAPIIDQTLSSHRARRRHAEESAASSSPIGTQIILTQIHKFEEARELMHNIPP